MWCYPNLIERITDEKLQNRIKEKEDNIVSDKEYYKDYEKKII